MQALDAARLEPLIGPDRTARYEAIAEATESLLSGRTVLNVNSTATGGGVAEMLQTLLAYGRGAGLDIRWLVIQGDPAFFEITKRIHNGLYGSPGDGGDLGDAERRHYERTLRRNADELRALVRPGRRRPDPRPPARRARRRDVERRRQGRLALPRRRRRAERVDRALLVVPAPVPRASRRVRVLARAPSRRPGPTSRSCTSSRPRSTPSPPRTSRSHSETCARILGYTGLIGGDGETPAVPFTRRDGSPGRVNRRVDVLQTGPPPPADAPLVVQVSRWDRMKDMPGVMSGFAEHVDPALGAHLLLAGPAVTGVADDPEAAEVLEECIELWRALPHAARSRVHLACTPMADPDEAAAIVNALQRHAAVVVQKSLAEGFGLTVAEAMWKSRPVVASAVGGIVDQIVSGAHGLLISDPRDLASFGTAVETLLRDRTEAARLGANARERARAEFLGDRHLEQYGRLLAELG